LHINPGSSKAEKFLHSLAVATPARKMNRANLCYSGSLRKLYDDAHNVMVSFKRSTLQHVQSARLAADTRAVLRHEVEYRSHKNPVSLLGREKRRNATQSCGNRTASLPMDLNLGHFDLFGQALAGYFRVPG
jgi:hypothetical protein